MTDTEWDTLKKARAAAAKAVYDKGERVLARFKASNAVLAAPPPAITEGKVDDEDQS